MREACALCGNSRGPTNADALNTQEAGQLLDASGASGEIAGFDALIRRSSRHALADTAADALVMTLRRCHSGEPGATRPARAAPTPKKESTTRVQPLRTDGAGPAAARECAAIAADLERVKALVTDAGDKLLASFNEVAARLPQMSLPEADKLRLVAAVTTAVTALQFQDMVMQLTGHAQRRLNVLQDCLKTLTHEPADPLLASTRMQPVRQSALGAGAIDLF